MASCWGRQSSIHILEGALGLLGTLALMVSALTSQWYNDTGLWEPDAFSEDGSYNQTSLLLSSRGPQLFFIGISFVMAAASFCVCLVFLFCWRQPKHSQNSHQVPGPGSLLLAVLLPTGLFFAVGWTIFTWQHWEGAQGQNTGFGYSYWLGASAWTILLVVFPVIYLTGECVRLGARKTP